MHSHWLHDSIAGPCSAVESDEMQELGDGTTAHRDNNVEVIQVRNILYVESDGGANCCLVTGVVDRPKVMCFVKHHFCSCIVLATAHVFGVDVTHCITVAGRTFEEWLCFDWCCFYYFLRNSWVALLEALFARIFLDLRYRCADFFFFS